MLIPPGSGRGPDAHHHVEATSTTRTTTDQGNGSIVESTAGAAASRRRDRIKLLLGSIAATTEKLADLIEAARDGEDHVVLGFASWTAYVAAEFSGLLAGLGTAERRVAVHALSVSGMPTRAIAEVAGISQSTAARDARVSHDDSPGEGEAAGETFVLADGKSYSATPAASPRPRRREPLPDAYRDAVHDLGKVVGRLARLHRDDRFAANRFSVRGRNHGPLARHCDELGALLAELTGGAR